MVIKIWYVMRKCGSGRAGRDDYGVGWVLVLSDVCKV